MFIYQGGGILSPFCFLGVIIMMVIVQPIDTPQSYVSRSRPHNKLNYLFLVETQFQIVNVSFQSEICYKNGLLLGSITLPISGKSGEETNFRVFDCNETDANIAAIKAAGNIKYELAQWDDLFINLVEDGAVGVECFRGSLLITSQTELDKYRLYG